MKAIVTVGISASGKTSWAENYCINNNNWININRDDTRFDLFTNGVRDWSKYKFTKANEAVVTKVNDDKLLEALESGLNVIISDTNLNTKVRLGVIDKLESRGYEVEIKEFPITFEEAVNRDNNRLGGVGKDIIYTQYLNWLKYKERKVYQPNLSKPNAILVDIDGTVAKMFDRSPFEWDKVDQDLPKQHVIDLVKGYTFGSDTSIIFMSGRDECCRDKTEYWLRENFRGFDFKLFMRPQGSFEKDTKIKEDLFWGNVADNYNVIFAIDDRPCVIRLWRELGIETICVSNPYIEF